MSDQKFICIHGHFYQPPREHAWLEVIELQDSAPPYHDWNERITAECYAPNTASRILNEKNVITKIINNYARISFNFGPTLLSWMEENDPETYGSIIEADKMSMSYFDGHGSAIAQVYNHMIMPLANKRDKETQILWGIRDFEMRFKRKPEGMWLAETAVDEETLELLADNEIRFTILAPRQAKAVRKIGDEEWNTLSDSTVNTRKSYLHGLPSGKNIILFFYDGEISQSIAFNRLLNDGKEFSKRLLTGFDTKDESPQLVNVATDGETYGHHHKHGDMALAFALDDIEKNESVSLTNYAHYLSIYQPTDEAQIIENSSWSCVHGVERWRDNCGCNTGGNPGWQQNWRKPLREALDWLRDTTIVIFEREASRLLKDPWAARNEYINVILRRSEDSVKRFLKSHAAVDAEPNKILRLMEMQRHSMLMYTSCGWFFDEVSGIETTQIMQYASRVIQLANQLTEIEMEEEFVKKLAAAPSNLSAYTHAGEVFKKIILPSKTNLQRVGMHYAASAIFEEEPESLPLFNYQATSEFLLKKEAGEQKLVLGIARVKSLVTWSEKKFSFATVYMGKHNIIGHISLDMDKEKFAGMQFRIVSAFEEGRLGDVIEIMQTFFGKEKYTIWHLFLDEKRKVLDMIARQSLEELEVSLRRAYNRDYPLVNALANNDIPIPNAYRTTFEYILNADLIKRFQSDKINTKELERISDELARWNLKIEDPDKVARLAAQSIYKELKRLSSERENLKKLQRLNRVFPILKKLNLGPDLYKSQNLFFEIFTDLDEKKAPRDPQWMEEFNLLGENLGIKLG
jgi:alpha-amylase/alpha-mannosidase (GH57 family)